MVSKKKQIEIAKTNLKFLEKLLKFDHPEWNKTYCISSKESLKSFIEFKKNQLKKLEEEK